MPVHDANGAQTLAIEHASGPIQILAGPGSGKTYLTIRRIRHLICHHGISPDKILVITFTKAAAAEMEERFNDLTKSKYSGVRFGTFHAVYYHILKQSGYYGGGKLLLASSADKWRYLQHILNMYDIKDADNALIGELLKKISYFKNNRIYEGNISEDETIQKIFPDIFKEFCRIMEEENKLDFDDMILLCDRMFEDNPSILTYWQHSFSHILVDEFQDIGILQYKVLKKLAAPENNLFVVGDDDQSIYGFREVDPEIMKKFMQDYPDAVQLTLEINYRCQENIVKASSLIIEDNKNRFAKKIKADHEAGDKVRLCSFRSNEDEYRYLSDHLRKMSAEELSMTAVIYRTNAQAAGLSRHLAKMQIPFCIKDKADNIFEHPIAKDMISYLQYAEDTVKNQRGRGKRSDFLQIMNKPVRYIHRSAAADDHISEKNLLDYYRGKPYMQDILRHFFADLRRIAFLRPYLAIDYIRKTIGYDIYLYENKGKAEKEKIATIADSIQETALDFRTFTEWKEYIVSYTENYRKSDTESVKNREMKRGGIPGVKIITMHGSKGLEYENVFLPDINKGNMPNRKAISAEQTEEERRLLYVAMTRAKKHLEILYYDEPSPFLEKLMQSPFINKEG